MMVRTVPHLSLLYWSAAILRDEVLRRPLGLSLTLAELSDESNDVHVCAYDSEQLVGCLVLSPNPNGVLRMRQVAVAPGRQGQGIGHKLVAFSESYAREQGYGEIMLHARLTAVPFYLQQEYTVIGEEFEEVSLPHLTMVKMMKPLHEAEPTASVSEQYDSGSEPKIGGVA